MDSFHDVPHFRVTVFGNKLSREAYNEWVIRNKYSKQAPTESQVVSKESAQGITEGMAAFACYQDPSHLNQDGRRDVTLVFSADANRNQIIGLKTWPLFQHFVRLVTDPFIYIREVCLFYQNDVFNEMAGAIISDHLKCEQLDFDFKDNSQKSITWIKNHAADGAFVDFLVTGANCTSSISTSDHGLLKVVTDFVQLREDNLLAGVLIDHMLVKKAIWYDTDT